MNTILFVALCLFVLLLCVYKVSGYLTLDYENPVEYKVKQERVERLVVLYSSAYRVWDKAVDKHIEMFDKIADDYVIGIHYWSEDSPETPPRQILEKKNKFSRSPNIVDSSETNQESQVYLRNYLKRYIYSTKIALENAESIYKETYGTEMPDEQIILRLRPDACMKEAVLPAIDDNYFMSLVTYTQPELRSQTFLTIHYCTKGALVKLLNIDSDEFMDKNYESIIEKTAPNTVWAQTIVTYMLESVGVKILKFSNSMYDCIMREGGEQEFINDYFEVFPP
jgi:hypothetical protein